MLPSGEYIYIPFAASTSSVSASFFGLMSLKVGAKVSAPSLKPVSTDWAACDDRNRRDIFETVCQW